MMTRFTLDGSDSLEKHLEQICHRVAADVLGIIPNGQLQALLLGGGYGRGQGGVLKTDSGDRPYNDLEFYVCLRGSELLNRKKYQHAFHKLEKKLSPQAGLDVEFKISSLGKLQKKPPTMFAYDLAWGHRSIVADEKQSIETTTPRASEIPLFEATRLLMNRCSGLLFARERLQRKPFTADDADFVGRNHAKAQLGFGDAFLAAHGRYHWDCRERNARLAKFSPEHKLPWLDEAREHHALGVEFKLHPRRCAYSLETFCDHQRALTHLGLKIWLWLESTRLNQMFLTASDYALSHTDKCPETNPVRNILINAKTFGFSFQGNPLRYPRERLLHSLALLLWEPATLTRPEYLRRVQSDLRTSANHFPDLVDAYATLWKQFN